MLSAVFTPSKPFLAPPQISASVSYPTGITEAQKEQAAASHAALTQRLRKFSFTNYAVPSPPKILSLPTPTNDGQDEVSDEVSPSESTLTDPSTANTSPETTPLPTPTQDDRDGSGLHFKSGHDVDVNVLVHDDDEGRDGVTWGLSGSLQMQDGYPATIFPPLSSSRMANDQDDQNIEDSISTPTALAFSASATNPVEIGKARGCSVEHEPSVQDPASAHIPTPTTQPLSNELMGTSPPFSLLAGMELRNGMFASKESSGLHWPWGGESKQESNKSLPNIVSPTPTHVTTSDAHISTSTPVQRTSSPLVPPQRQKSQAHSQVSTFSIGRTSSSSSRSGSGGSGSGSETASGGHSSRASVKNSVPSRPKLVSPHPWPPAPQNQLRRVMSPPPALPFMSRRIFEIKADDDDEAIPPAQILSHSRNSSSELTSPTSPANDAVYQAFVRQWCFAQGPAPTVGAGPPRKSEKIGPLTPDVAVR